MGIDPTTAMVSSLQGAVQSAVWLAVVLVLVTASGAMLWQARRVKTDTAYVWAIYAAFPVLAAIAVFIWQDVQLWQGLAVLGYAGAIVAHHVSQTPRRRRRTS